MYAIASRLVQVFLFFAFKRTYINKEVLPKTGGYILAGRHISWLDVVSYGVAVLPRQIHFMGKEELFANKAVAWLLSRIKRFSSKSRPSRSPVL